jgi:hypothetical protein
MIKRFNMAPFTPTTAARIACVFSVVATLSACGGGGDSAPAAGGASTPAAQTPATDVQPIGFTASAQTLASKTTTSNLSFDSSKLTILGGCGKTVTNQTVYLQTHTAVFAAEGVSENDQIEAAEHSENAVKELRQRFPNPRSTNVGLWDNKRVHVCIQNESLNNGFQAGAAITDTGPTHAGKFVAVSGSNYFFITSTSRGALAQNGYAVGKSYQAIYQALFKHELMHVTQSAQSSVQYTTNTYDTVDPWFTEGIAVYTEFGKSGITREAIGSDLLTINPITASNKLVAFPANQYRAAGATLVYLLSPLGASNSEATVTTFFGKLQAEMNAQIALCVASQNASPDCALVGGRFEAWRSAMFARVFETTFKNKDGSPMRLRSGTNNLQDTLAQRIGEFW